MGTRPDKSRENVPLDAPPDWDALRLQSLTPGGFGGERAYIWPRLLHVDVNPIHFPDDQKEHEPHQDERQIRLDTDRSFVLYPVDHGPEDGRLARQAELNKLIVQVFRRRPGLNYFQGFHDIATVIQLTLPPDVALHALEKLSLHRLRDSMGHTLEPLTGLMCILQRLLRLADPRYAALLEEHAPLPYAALPHLLTLFAHATPTLPLIQHIFDFLLVRPPLIIVYLVAAVTLSRKDQVVGICGGGDEGMIHSVLTGLPEFTEYSNVRGVHQAKPDPDPAVAVTGHSDVIPLSKAVDDALSACEVPNSACNNSEPDLHIGASLPSPTLEPRAGPLVATATVGAAAGTLSNCLPRRDESLPSTAGVCDIPVPPLSLPEISISSPPSTPAPLEPADIPLPPSAAPTPPTSPTRAESPYPQTGHSLLSVLLHTDELFSRFPPSTPQLRLTRTLGPASAMQTWAQDATLLPSDDRAEALVVAGIDIVVCDDELESASQKKESQPKARKRSMRKAKRGETQLLVAGAVLVLGVAVAVSVRSHGKMDWRALFGTVGAFGEKALGMFGGDAQLAL
ncbi:rab-GTPase-TBC domain-containing protein [Russula brevipes]|nr:rab-GTPase-TBC domain-containing protein [Russula brevipes]